MKPLLLALSLALAALAVPSASAGSCDTEGGLSCEGAFVCVPFTVDVRGGEAEATCTTAETGMCWIRVGGSPPILQCEDYGPPGDGS